MSDAAVELRDVAKRYPHFELADINLKLAKGQMVGLIGQNGAGKSTTLRILLGLVRPDAGDVRVLGHLMPQEQVHVKAKLGFLSEDMRLYSAATLAWHMAFLARIFPTWDRQYAEHLVKKFRLKPDQKMKGLSHGQRVKAGLLLALARKPKLLILDEPTTGLDPIAKADVLGEMMEVLVDEDRTVLFSSHTTQDVEQLSDHIVFIDEGRVLDSASKDQFLEKWRRVQLTVKPGTTIPDPWQVTGQGALKTLVTDQFSAERFAELKQQGHDIHQVQPMSLEEIFVARVALERKEVAA